MNAADIVAALANNPEQLLALKRLLGGGEEFYSSVNLPPDIPSRKRFREVVKTMPGATKMGNSWIVEKSVWHGVRCAQKVRRIETDDEIAERALKEAGYRRTK